MMKPTITDIKDAHKRISPFIHRTPILTCESLNQLCQAELFFKCENFQKGGAFKIRGATNAVFSLDPTKVHGVATHSSGNHAAALALAATWRGIKAYVVMPENTIEAKRRAVTNYGAEIIYCPPTLQAREEFLADLVQETGATFIPSYNDLRIISGQGTAALEILDEAQDLDILMTPVGGGGLLSGTAITVAAASSRTHVIAAEPERADDAYRSFHAGKIIPVDNPDTIADGLRTSLGDLTFPIIKNLVKEIILVSEESIIAAMRLIWERMKIIVEPSAAVTLGALISKRIDLSNKRIGIILTGGNVDLDNLPWIS